MFRRLSQHGEAGSLRGLVPRSFIIIILVTLFSGKQCCCKGMKHRVSACGWRARGLHSNNRTFPFLLSSLQCIQVLLKSNLIKNKSWTKGDAVLSVLFFPSVGYLLRVGSLLLCGRGQAAVDLERRAVLSGVSLLPW